MDDSVSTDSLASERKFTTTKSGGLALDITGEVYGQLTAIHRTESKNANGCYLWMFKCSCGSEVLREIGNLRGSQTRRNSAKCDVCATRDSSKRLTIHGMSHTGSKAYKSWSKIKERCFVETNKDYYKYGAVGISMYEGWRNNFQAFYDYIGDPPDTETKYSIDRIDNRLGYAIGNIRWATAFQQARNRSKHKSNKTGYTGVQLEEKMWPCGTKSTLYAKATWKEGNKNKSRRFNVNVYGKDEALRLACECRDKMIEKLNAEGAGYSPAHGKDLMLALTVGKTMDSSL